MWVVYRGLDYPYCGRCGPSAAQAFGLAYRLMNDVCPEDVVQVAPGLCLSCSRELTPALDAYYGKDPIEGKKCMKCRRTQ